MDNKIKKILSVLFVTMFVVTLTASAVSARSVDVTRTSISGSTITGGSSAASAAGGLYEDNGAISHDLVNRADLSTYNAGTSTGGDVRIVTGTVDLR